MMTLNDYQQRAMETCLPESENFAYMMLNLVVEKASYRHVYFVVTDFFLGGVSSDMPRLLEEKKRFFKNTNLKWVYE